MRPVKVTPITKDTISNGVERVSGRGYGLQTAPSEPNSGALRRTPLAASGSQAGKRSEDKTTKPLIGELTKPAVRISTARADPINMQRAAKANLHAQSRLRHCTTHSGVCRVFEFPDGSNILQWIRPIATWHIKQQQQQQTSQATTREPRWPPPTAPQKRCPGRGDRGGGWKETRLSGAGDLLPRANHCLFRQ